MNRTKVFLVMYILHLNKNELITEKYLVSKKSENESNN